MPGRIAIFQHAASEGPGYIRTWLETHGYTLDFIRWWEDPVDALDSSWQGCVILGGSMNIYQHRDHPWLIEEKRLLEMMLARRVPLLGICLGAQLLADLLGARVVQNPHEEIGWWPVHFSAEARKRFSWLPQQTTCLHWHGDTFSRPPDSCPLGESSACPEQGFVHSDFVVGLQFHPEIDGPLLQDFCGDGSEKWPQGEWVQSRDQILQQGDKLAPSAQQLLASFLHFLFRENHLPPTL